MHLQSYVLRAALSVMMIALISFGWMLHVPVTEAALDTPQLINYQARITDASRITVDDAALDYKFAIYDASTGGNCLWSADDTDATSSTIDCAGDTPDGSISISSVDGIISVDLGDTTGGAQNALPDALFDDNATLFLGVTVGADAEMTPRKRITSAPYALQAGDSDLLDSLDTDNDGCTSACVPVTDSNGNIVFIGDPQGTGVSGGTVYVNPASADADETLFGIALGGVSRFTVDEDGDAVVAADLSVNGNATIGDAATDTLTITADVASNILPSANDTYTLGNSTERWQDLYLGPNSLHIGADGDEGIIGFDTTSNYIEFDTDGDATEEVRFGTNIATQGVMHLYDGTSAYATLNGGLYSSAAAVIVPGVLQGDNMGVFANDSLTLSLTRDTNAALYVNDTTYTVGDAGANLDETGILNVVTSAARTTTGTYEFSGEKGDITYNGTGASSTLYGTNYLVNADPSSTLTAAYGTYNDVEMNGAGTVTSGYGYYGLYDQIHASGTTTSAYGVYGEALETAGTITTGYGGYFKSSGAGTNYSIYADAGYVHIEGDGTPTTPDSASDDGDLFVKGLAEFDNTIIADYSTTSTVAASEPGITVGVTDTGVVSSGNDLTYGIKSSVLRTGASGGLISSFGGHFSVEGDAGGTSTAAGIYADAHSADTNYAIYTERGYVHIEGDSTPTASAWSVVGADGSLFVKNDVQIDTGALCVGSAATPCDGSTGTTDGTIYAVNTTVQGNDVAETFPSSEFLIAGEIVSVSGEGSTRIQRTHGSDIIIGAVSTAPGLTLGFQDEDDSYFPVALAGRAPVKVNGEGGAIDIGDRVTISSKPGVGMKASQKSEVVGIAMQAFDGDGEGAVMTFIQPHFWDGTEVATVTEQAPSPSVAPTQSLTVNSNVITNIARIEGLVWSVDESGFFKTSGAYTVDVRSHQNTDVATAAVLGMEHYITLAGTSKIESGLAIVEFENVAPEFNDIISAEAQIIVTATMSDGSGDVYVTDKSPNGFTLNRNGSGNGTEVDWIVMALRRGLEPDEALEIPTDDADDVIDALNEDEVPSTEEDPVSEDEPITEEEVEEPIVDELEEEIVEEASEVVEEEIDEEAAEPVVESSVDEPLDNPEPETEPEVVEDEPSEEPESEIVTEESEPIEEESVPDEV